MKLEGFREITLNYGCIGLECTSVEIPLDRVLAERLTSIEFVNSAEESKINMGRWWVQEMSFKTQTSELKKFRGAVAYPSQDALIDLLLNDYEPVYNRDVDAIIKRIHKMEEPQRSRTLAEYIWREEKPFAYKRLNDRSFPHNFPGVPIRILNKNSVRATLIDGENVYLLNAADFSTCCYYVEKKIKYGKFSVPRWLYIISERDGPSYFWDGFYFKKFTSYLEDSFVKELSKNGKAILNFTDDYYPRPELEPVILLRIPPLKEVKELSIQELEKLPIPSLLNLPLFIRDTRTAVPLPSNLPIIENHTDILYFLSRLNNNIYIPKNLAHHYNNYLKENEYFLIGLRLKLF